MLICSLCSSNLSSSARSRRRNDVRNHFEIDSSAYFLLSMFHVSNGLQIGGLLAEGTEMPLVYYEK